ncbi:hypothetical protein PM082_010089 [Marasmius tenuissimus]|nr:hypothetical protein PM082_010089 [Marasmius tenuissimus]
MKGCLKKTVTTSSPHNKSAHVSWCNKDDGGLEHVHTADDWDRTAVQPARQPLSYGDILELKAIQRSLPRAEQPPDPFSGKPGTHYLSKVPIALLPLGPA